MSAFVIKSNLVEEGQLFFHSDCAKRAGEGEPVGAVPVGTTCAWCEGEDGLPVPICSWCHGKHEFTDCNEVAPEWGGDDSYDFGCQEN